MASISGMRPGTSSHTVRTFSFGRNAAGETRVIADHGVLLISRNAAAATATAMLKAPRCGLLVLDGACFAVRIWDF